MMACFIEVQSSRSSWENTIISDTKNMEGTQCFSCDLLVTIPAFYTEYKETGKILYCFLCHTCVFLIFFCLGIKVQCPMI